MLCWWQQVDQGCQRRLVEPSEWSRPLQTSTYEYDPLHHLVSLLQLVKHGAAVSKSPYFFLSPKRLGAGELSIYRILPTCSDSHSLETITHNPSPSLNSCFMPWQICSIQCLQFVKCPIRSPLLHWCYFREQGKVGEHLISHGLQTFVNNIAKQYREAGYLWFKDLIYIVFCKVPRTKYGT